MCSPSLNFHKHIRFTKNGVSMGSTFTKHRIAPGVAVQPAAYVENAPQYQAAPPSSRRGRWGWTDPQMNRLKDRESVSIELEPEITSAPGEDVTSGSDLNELSATCYDVTELEDLQTSYYLKANPNNIVFLLPPVNGERWGRRTRCSSRDELKMILSTPTNIFFPCDNNVHNNNGDLPVDINARFIRLPLIDSYLVPEKDVVYAIESSELTFFQLRDSGTVLQSTASYDAIVFDELVGADHCQADTQKKVYRVRGVRQMEFRRPARLTTLIHTPNAVSPRRLLSPTVPSALD